MVARRVRCGTWGSRGWDEFLSCRGPYLSPLRPTTVQPRPQRLRSADSVPLPFAGPLLPWTTLTPGSTPRPWISAPVGDPPAFGVVGQSATMALPVVSEPEMDMSPPPPPLPPLPALELSPPPLHPSGAWIPPLPLHPPGQSCRSCPGAVLSVTPPPLPVGQMRRRRRRRGDSESSTEGWERDIWDSYGTGRTPPFLATPSSQSATSDDGPWGSDSPGSPFNRLASRCLPPLSRGRWEAPGDGV